jgi:hypothetical protein
MKKLLISAVVASVFFTGSWASAAVVVHAGPVHVGIGRSLARPAFAHRPVYAPVRPVVVRPPLPRPVIAAPTTVVTPPAVTPAPVTGSAAAAIRARRLLNAIHAEVEDAVEDALKSAQ